MEKTKYIFITGIPTAGKSHLAHFTTKNSNILHVKIDDLRKEMSKDPNLRPWVNMFLNKDEKNYWETITPEEHWNNLVLQSEAFWPSILKKIKEIKETGKSAIFEGVNILPHLANKDIDFSGIVLIANSEEIVFNRCQKNPRWGATKELQKTEAKWFFQVEGKKDKQEAQKYNYNFFNSYLNAKIELENYFGL